MFNLAFRKQELVLESRFFLTIKQCTFVASVCLLLFRSKQCNSFKTRANQVKGGLEIGVPGITVLINPDKPRRGCFEIREEGGETFISLLGLKRPFKPMKDLNMEEVIGNIIKKIK
ncbi:protein FAM9A-like [Prunus yedoensis var. nudiflora]|uniref:Protein FAM9A-like n=1 Tax=Prunus yedoensis var. nudiflora TaxID=2094558 RepID=A0A314YBJ2_PRUYE|nr:protein FAM9A-like [Prunus yedoensis var. nudiflora]